MSSARFDASLSEDGRYRVLVDAIADYAICMLDPDGQVSSWNAGARRFKGYEAYEIIGHHFSRFYTDEDRLAGLPQRALGTAAAEGRFENEGWRVRKDGTRFWAHVVIDRISAPDGSLLGFAKITRDLTERRQARENLRRSEEQFRLLVQAVIDYAIYMIDTSGRVTSWNPGAERIKGYRPDEIIGEHFPGSTRPRTRRPANPPERCELPSPKAGSRTRAGESARTAAASGPTSSSTRSAAKTERWSDLPRLPATSPSAATTRSRSNSHASSCCRCRKWTRSASSRGESRTISTIC